MSDYPAEQRKQSGFGNLGNGEPANLFSSSDVIDEHFKWMKEEGTDGVALQRFIGDSPYPISNSSTSKPIKVKKAAEANQRFFYICYYMSSGKDENAWVESIKYDWGFNIEQYLAYFDDILISTKKDNSTGLAPIKNNQLLPFVTSKNRTLIFNNIHINSHVKVYNISGRLLSEFVLNSTEVPMDLRNGIYILFR